MIVTSLIEVNRSLINQDTFVKKSHFFMYTSLNISDFKKTPSIIKKYAYSLVRWFITFKIQNLRFVKNHINEEYDDSSNVKDDKVLLSILVSHHCQ